MMKIQTIYLFGQRIDVNVPEDVAATQEDEVIVTFQKELETSDVSTGQSRLFMPNTSKVRQWLSKEDMWKFTVVKEEEPSSSEENTTTSSAGATNKKRKMKNNKGLEVEVSPSSEDKTTSSGATTNKKKRKRKNNKGLEVEVKDGEGRRFRLNLAYWDSVKKFVLNRGWNKIVKQNNLQKGDAIQLSCYARKPNDNNNDTLLHLGLEICKRSCS